MAAGNAKPVALVTGGANGIGRAIAHHLLSAGWRLGVVDLPDSGLRRAYARAGRRMSPRPSASFSTARARAS